LNPAQPVEALRALPCASWWVGNTATDGAYGPDLASSPTSISVDLPGAGFGVFMVFCFYRGLGFFLGFGVFEG
jgi:hypothetical protein